MNNVHKSLSSPSSNISKTGEGNETNSNVRIKNSYEWSIGKRRWNCFGNNRDGICIYINNLKDVEYWVSHPKGNSEKGNLDEIEGGQWNDVNISGEMVFQSIVIKTHFKITFTIKK